MTNEIPEDPRPTMPLETLVDVAVYDLGDWNDGTNGHRGGQFDSTSGVLTLRHDAGDVLTDDWKTENEFEDYRDTGADFVELGAVVRLIQKVLAPLGPPPSTETTLDIIAELLDHGRLELHPGPVSRETEAG